MNFRICVVVSLLLPIFAVCLFEHILSLKSAGFREFEEALVQSPWILLIWIIMGCLALTLLQFEPADLAFFALIIVIIAACFTSGSISPASKSAIVFVGAMALGKGVKVLLNVRTPPGRVAVRPFLLGVLLLLAFSAWWHLPISKDFYPGNRWTGLWDNPNLYGLLMAAGFVLTVGLAVAGRMPKAVLAIVAVMLGVGLFCSYSRGAWLGTAVGILYLTASYRRLRWQVVASVIFLITITAICFWNRASESAPWYVKRLDLSRPSAQHRVAAWKAGLEIIWDHPLGVGWNGLVQTYEKSYSPPENGALAISTNDYLMMGGQLGLTGLICFLLYVGWRLKIFAHRVRLPKEIDPGLNMAVRAASVTMLVIFWFDGGLFVLSTASMFWLLLELGDSSKPDPAPKITGGVVEHHG